MHRITLYNKPNCPLCDKTRFHLQRLIAAEPDSAVWAIEEVSILDDQNLFAAYRYVIPVVAVDGGAPLGAPESMDPARLWQAMHAAPPSGHPQSAALEAPAPAPAPTGVAGPAVARGAYDYGPPPGGVLGALDRFGNWLGAHWLRVANTGVGVFAGLPWLAPIFAALGWWALADPIYTMYMFFCHQLPERAGSLFGYQVAYCYRNTAIYTSVFLTGLLYAAARRGLGGDRLRSLLRPLRWQVFLLLLLPVAIDGFTHMLGLRENNLWFDQLTGGRFGDFSAGDSLGTLNWWLRVISGGLFGFAVVRFAYPWINMAFDESRRMVWPAAATPSPASGEQPRAVAS
jgi:uncharacterized membrane protein